RRSRGELTMRPFAVALTVAVLLCVIPGLDRADAATPFNVGAVNDSGGLVVFVAVDKGFFAKHGIDGKVIVRNSGPEVTRALDAGAVWEPDLTRILEKVKGSRLLVRGGDVVCFCAAMHARPEVLYRDRDATQRYVDAMAEAARFVRDPKNLDEISVIASRHVS